MLSTLGAAGLASRVLACEATAGSRSGRSKRGDHRGAQRPARSERISLGTAGCRPVRLVSRAQSGRSPFHRQRLQGVCSSRVLASGGGIPRSSERYSACRPARRSSIAAATPRRSSLLAQRTGPELPAPDRSGDATDRLEAMIAHSDNTATDIVLRHAGPERVQASSTGSACGSLQIRQHPPVLRIHHGRPELAIHKLGPVAVSGSCRDPPADPQRHDHHVVQHGERVGLVLRPRASRRILQYHETLEVFRSILAIGDAVLPRCHLASWLRQGEASILTGAMRDLRGGVYVPDRWVYFAMLLNWTDSEAGLSTEVLGS